MMPGLLTYESFWNDLCALPAESRGQFVLCGLRYIDSSTRMLKVLSKLPKLKALDENNNEYVSPNSVGNQIVLRLIELRPVDFINLDREYDALEEHLGYTNARNVKNILCEKFIDELRETRSGRADMVWEHKDKIRKSEHILAVLELLPVGRRYRVAKDKLSFRYMSEKTLSSEAMCKLFDEKKINELIAQRKIHVREKVFDHFLRKLNNFPVEIEGIHTARKPSVYFKKEKEYKGLSEHEIEIRKQGRLQFVLKNVDLIHDEVSLKQAMALLTDIDANALAIKKIVDNVLLELNSEKFPASGLTLFETTAGKVNEINSAFDRALQNIESIGKVNFIDAFFQFKIDGKFSLQETIEKCFAASVCELVMQAVHQIVSTKTENVSEFLMG